MGDWEWDGDGGAGGEVMMFILGVVSEIGPSCSCPVSISSCSASMGPFQLSLTFSSFAP